MKKIIVGGILVYVLGSFLYGKYNANQAREYLNEKRKVSYVSSNKDTWWPNQTNAQKVVTYPKKQSVSQQPKESNQYMVYADQLIDMGKAANKVFEYYKPSIEEFIIWAGEKTTIAVKSSAKAIASVLADKKREAIQANVQKSFGSRQSEPRSTTSANRQAFQERVPLEEYAGPRYHVVDEPVKIVSNDVYADDDFIEVVSSPQLPTANMNYKIVSYRR